VESSLATDYTQKKGEGQYGRLARDVFKLKLGSGDEPFGAVAHLSGDAVRDEAQLLRAFASSFSMKSLGIESGRATR
jgi:hypothetical protein